MNKCPQCLNVLSVSVEVCPKCDFSIIEDITKTLSLINQDETNATKILSDEKMTPEKWQKIKGLFEAIQDVSPDEREQFLENACGDDFELKREVKKLLGSFENADSFLESPVVGEAVSMFENKKTLVAGNTTGSINDGKFVAGTVLDERYRIIGMLGKGGMGEVYKAEDLKLEQTVALKFLPEKLEKNEAALKRFIGEVKTARQVSHANVCKVYDIGDIDGKHFLSMEFIDGDDLSQLLRRIGRLPSDKAAEISRQICFGLHAIHEAGILHRDLKPANIIIDSNGKARITDFGIAGIEAEINNEEIRVGTPAYMSPEQITGKEVTTKSDIYSLGLLLYEIFTGKQAINADSFEELLEKQKTTQPTNPSEFVENIEPVVEKTINRCLEKNPNDRPKNALQVALSLPGGNPLEAAIAAGETPSPEMVAAAPKKGALKPFVALGILIAYIIIFFGVIALNHKWQSYSFTPLEKSPEVLAEKSREILKKFGYTETPTDAEYEFAEDETFLNYRGFFNLGEKPELPPIKKLLKSAQPYNIYFLYRQSPEYLAPIDSVKVTEIEPPLDRSGMANVKLDVRGRLVEFLAVPPKNDFSANVTEVNWSDIFVEAGLDLNKFEEIEPNITPPVFAEQRKAWTGTFADFPTIPIRIESASYKGKPVFFKIFAPWDTPVKQIEVDTKSTKKYGTILIILLICIAAVGSMVLAYRNLKAGRGDLRGGLKLTILLFAAVLLSQLIIADHIPTIWDELSIIYEAISYAVIYSIFIGILYIALEPFVRRWWSEMLISWSRIMAGDFRDPMVGRDVLIGGLLGLGHAVGINIGILLVQQYTGNFDSVTNFFTMSGINGTGTVISDLLIEIVASTAISLIWLFIAYLFFRLTGKKNLSVLVVGLLFFLIQFLLFALTLHWLLCVAAFINAVCLVIALGRYGLLGMIAFWFFFNIVYSYPITFDTSSFYFPASVLTILISMAMIFYAFYISLAGQMIFRGKILKDIDQ